MQMSGLSATTCVCCPFIETGTVPGSGSSPKPIGQSRPFCFLRNIERIKAMGERIDFKELRAALRFPAVLEHYGVQLKAKGDQAQGFCPLPTLKGEGRPPS